MAEEAKNFFKFITLKEASELPECNIKSGSLRAAINRDRLPAKKVGNTWLVLRVDLFTYLNNRQVGRPQKPH